jgi:hypothetical protein
LAEGRAVAAVAAVSLRGTVPFLASNFGKAGSENATRGWISGALAVSAAGSDNDTRLFFFFFFFSDFQCLCLWIVELSFGYNPFLIDLRM